MSLFRYGFDYLRNIVVNLNEKMDDPLTVLQFLPCIPRGVTIPLLPTLGQVQPDVLERVLDLEQTIYAI
jgi:hypothetical protein